MLHRLILAFLLLSGAASCWADDPALKLNLELYLQGKDLFERNCMVCHGVRGDGLGELGVTLQPRPRSFREGMFKFRSTPFGSLPTEADLAKTIRGGLSGTGMGMFTHLQDDDVRAVIEYVKSFSRRWRKAENYAPPMKLPPPPGWMSDKAQQAPHIAAGKPLFVTHCSACHGANADGKGPAIAGLKDIWDQAAKPADLRQPHLRCGDAPADIYRVLATGLNGTPMVTFEGTLSPTQRWDIIAYVTSLKLPDIPNLGAAPATTLVLQTKP